MQELNDVVLDVLGLGGSEDGVMLVGEWLDLLVDDVVAKDDGLLNRRTALDLSLEGLRRESAGKVWDAWLEVEMKLGEWHWPKIKVAFLQGLKGEELSMVNGQLPIDNRLFAQVAQLYGEYNERLCGAMYARGKVAREKLLDLIG